MKRTDSRPSTGERPEKGKIPAPVADETRSLRETPAGHPQGETVPNESRLSDIRYSYAGEARAHGFEDSPEGKKRMIIKVCGLREVENIRHVCRLDINWIGFIFYPRSPRYVLSGLPDGPEEGKQRFLSDLFSAVPGKHAFSAGQDEHPVSAGGDKPPFPTREGEQSFTAGSEESPASSVNRARSVSPAPRRVGVFVDESAARIREIADACRLDYLQLHGHETPDECYALQKRGYSIIKAFSIGSAADLLSTEEYEGRADYFLFDTRCEGYGGSGRRFDWDLLSSYTGETPFLLSGGIGPDSLDALRTFRHPRLAGIDLNSAFESSPGRKDIQKLAHFIRAFRTL